MWDLVAEEWVNVAEMLHEVIQIQVYCRDKGHPLIALFFFCLTSGSLGIRGKSSNLRHAPYNKNKEN